MIRVFDDPEALARGTAELVVEAALQAVAARGRFSLALSGGGTPRRTYELLAQPPCRDLTPWSQTHIFWGDERWVPSDDPRSNARMAYEALLAKVPIPAGQIHPMDFLPVPERGAERYEALLRNFLGAAETGLDLILLGLGENGHTASLFPGDPALAETGRWVVPVYVAEQDLHRLTLTAAFINRARFVAFLATGAAKAVVVREVIRGPRDPERLPAQLIQPEPGKLQWYLDKDAAGELRQMAAGTESFPASM